MVGSEELSYALPSQSWSAQYSFCTLLNLPVTVEAAPPALNPTAPAFRPRRNAAVAARTRIQELAQMNDED